MKEAFEKIIERLEKVRDERALAAEHTLDVFPDGQVSGLEKAIEIVNQVAEEYSSSEIPNKSDGWIPCSERLPEKKGVYFVTEKWIFPGGRTTVLLNLTHFDKRWYTTVCPLYKREVLA